MKPTCPIRLAAVLAGTLTLLGAPAAQAEMQMRFDACPDKGSLADIALVDIGEATSPGIAASCVLPESETEESAQPRGVVEIWVPDEADGFSREASLVMDSVPGTFASGDLDGDGTADLAIVTQPADGRGLTLFVGRGDGTFTPEPLTHRMGGATAKGAVFHDTDWTDRMDVVLAGRDFNSGGVVLRNQGEEAMRRFSEALLLPDEEGVGSVVQELSGDLHQDLAALVYRRGDVRLFLGGGAERHRVFLGKGVRQVADVVGGGLLNDDFLPDLVVAGHASDDAGAPAYLVLSRSGEEWGLSDPLPEVTNPVAARAGDFDGDGLQELAVLTEADAAAASQGVALFTPDETAEAFVPDGRMAFDIQPDVLRTGPVAPGGGDALIGADRDTGMIEIRTR